MNTEIAAGCGIHQPEDIFQQPVKRKIPLLIPRAGIARSRLAAEALEGSASALFGILPEIAGQLPATMP